MITPTFVTSRSERAGALAIPVPDLGRLRRLLPKEVTDIANAAAGRFDGEAGSLFQLHTQLDGTVQRLLIIGTGKDYPGEAVGAALVAHLLTSGESAVAVDLRHIEAHRRAHFAARLAQGAMLRSWRHDRHRTEIPESDRATLSTIEVIVGDALQQTHAAWEPLQAAAAGTCFARELVAEPGNVIYPDTFVEHCRHLDELGIEIEVLDESAMRELGMGALLGVARGSSRSPRLLCLKWDGTDGAAEPVAFVGKGVTFDTGGISIKPAAGMEAMKWDMGGAAAVVGAVKALATRRAKAHVIAVCGLVENMPDGNSMRPGDVVRTMSGKTVEVINTDAEGRLVLCDLLTWVQKRHGVKTIVDLATLTGAIIVSLGHEMGGMFANDDLLADALASAGDLVGEELWRMPLSESFDRLIDSKIADVKNSGPREASSAQAAHFLRRFIDEGVRWAHLDIAGMAWANKPGALHGEGATGFGVRLLDRYVRNALEHA